jgi:hypothetical protein
VIAVSESHNGPRSVPRTMLGIVLDLSSSTRWAFDDVGAALKYGSLITPSPGELGTRCSKHQWLYDSIRSTDTEVFLYGLGFQAGKGIVDLSSLAEAGKNASVRQRVAAFLDGSIEFATGMRRVLASVMIPTLLSRLSGPLGGIVGTVSSAYFDAPQSVSEGAAVLWEETQRIGEVTLDVAHLPTLFRSTGENLSSFVSKEMSTFGLEELSRCVLEKIFFGPCALTAVAKRICDRFDCLSTRDFDQKVLVVVCGGTSSDGDPRATFRKIRESGVIVATCFISRDDSQCTRVLYSDGPDSSWSEGERLLWDISSRVSDLPGELARAVGPGGSSVALFTRASARVVAKHVLQFADALSGALR